MFTVISIEGGGIRHDEVDKVRSIRISPVYVHCDKRGEHMT